MSGEASCFHLTVDLRDATEVNAVAQIVQYIVSRNRDADPGFIETLADLIACVRASLEDERLFANEEWWDWSNNDWTRLAQNCLALSEAIKARMKDLEHSA